jgi:AraC-like DNA-binding protein
MVFLLLVVFGFSTKPLTMIRLFAELSGHYQFLIRTRVLAAARLLEETDLTATEVSAKCGFVDGSSFSQLFQRRTGMTPIAFRKKGLRRK